MALALDMARGLGKSVQSGAPTVAVALEAYLARPKLRSEVHKHGVRLQLARHLKEWLRLPLRPRSPKRWSSSVTGRWPAYPRVPTTRSAEFRSVWNHARRTFDLPECPTVAIEWYEEEPSGQLIEDLPAWAAAVDELDNPIHSAFYQADTFHRLSKERGIHS